MLSNTSRLFTYLIALLYAVVGVLLFAMPEQLTPVFAWQVTQLVTMTVGGWCLGNAWAAFFSARRWQWAQIQPAMYYLWFFGLLELGVMFVFRERLRFGHPVAALYVGTLIANGVAALVGIFDVVRLQPAVDQSGARTSSLQYTAVILFILGVGFLGYYGVTAQIGDVGTNGGIFPEVMTPLTLRSFGVFYLSIALGVVPLLWNRNLQTFLSHGFVSYGLIIFITLAAFVYLRLFDFAQRPGGLAYFGAYLAVGIVFLYYFRKYGIEGV
ncbi:MAG TPA: hypothetical protein VMJ90_01435 [Anaerolineales bacterium]|nr:hypothetical protein [Anaerolineales bacterium]